MALRIGFAWLLRLVAVLGSATLATVMISVVKSGIAQFLPPRGALSLLIPALIAPWGVVLFALLLEQVGKVVERDVPRAL